MSLKSLDALIENIINETNFSKVSDEDLDYIMDKSNTRSGELARKYTKTKVGRHIVASSALSKVEDEALAEKQRRKEAKNNP